MTDFTKYGNWCPAIYHGLYIERWNDDHVRIAPCCQAETSIEPSDTFTHNDSPYLNLLREKFARDERPSACNRCWDYEKHHTGTENLSRRQRDIITYEITNKKTEPDYSILLSSLDYCCTWVCNLACAICRPLNSSLWSAELKQTDNERKLIGRLYKIKKKLIDQLGFDNIHQVHFNGGEPLATKDHIEVLQKLAHQDVLKNTIVSYNTNGTLYPSDEIINLWQQAKKVTVSFSIDGTGPAYNYIRYPADWNQVTTNMMRMKHEMPNNVVFGFTVAVGALNVFNLPELWKWYSDNIYTHTSSFSWQFITEMELGTLPVEIRLDAIETLKNYPIFNGVASYIQSTIDDPTIVDNNQHAKYEPLWSDQLDTIDARRGTNWREALTIGKYYR